MITDFLRHLFPRVVLEKNLRLSYTFCLGGLAFTAFLVMLASGMLLHGQGPTGPAGGRVPRRVE